ncbi:hypothetical protein [Veillonella infantium]
MISFGILIATIIMAAK